MNKLYTPGNHLLLTLDVKDTALLCAVEDFVNFAKVQIERHDLHIVGITSHIFDGNGFTAAICLMESHISIHTWPEFNQLTLDVYLCNYLKDNSHKVQQLGQLFKAYFSATVRNETLVTR